MTTTAELASRRCQPLKGAQHRLSDEMLGRYMEVLSRWDIVEDGGAITRTFRFPDYHRTMAFVNALADIAHAEDHHPDLGVHYDRVVVRYSTHDVGGLSENDVTCAAKADVLFGG
jgi:4a-hydroxytetrahydrobiopterin dehydratase